MNTPDLNTKRILELARDRRIKESALADAVGDTAQNFSQKKQRADGVPPIPLAKLPAVAKVLKMDIHELLEELRPGGNVRSFQEEQPHYGSSISGAKNALDLMGLLFDERKALGSLIEREKQNSGKS